MPAQVEQTGDRGQRQAADRIWTEARKLYLAADFDGGRRALERLIGGHTLSYDVWEAWIATFRPEYRLDAAREELMPRLAAAPNDPRLHCARGLVARYSGNLAVARGLFERAADLDPKSEAPPYYLARCFPTKHPRYKALLQESLRRNNRCCTVLADWIKFQLRTEKRSPEDVGIELRTKYQSDASPEILQFARSAVLHFRKPSKRFHKLQAVELLEDVVSGRPEEAKAWEMLAELYRELKEFEKAANALQQGRALRWWWPTWLDEQEHLTYSRSGANAALARAREFQEFFPDYWHAQEVFGLDLADTGHTEEAIEALKAAVNRDWLQSVGSVRWNLGLMLARARRFSEAVDMYLETLEVSPDYMTTDDRDVPGVVINVLKNLSPQDRRELDQRIRQNESDNNVAWPLFMRGRIATVEKRHTEASQAFAAIVNQFPSGHAPPLAHWGQQLVKQQRFADASERFLEALRQDRSHSKIFHGAGTNYPGLKDLLIQWVSSKTENQPTENMLLAYRIRSLDKQPDDVIQDLHQLITEYPKEREPLIYLADSLETLGEQRVQHHQYEEALAWRLRLCSLNEQLGIVDETEKQADYRAVAELYARLGDFDAAYLFFQHSGDDAYRRAIDLLQSGSHNGDPFPMSSYGRIREIDNQPRVFDISNSVKLAEDNTLNVKNANYQLGLTDVSFGESTLLTIQRFYNSRSLHHGWFGKGWTTLFETDLGYDDDGRIAVRTSGGFIVKFHTSLVQRVAKELLRRWELDGKSITTELQKRLGEDDSFVMAEARKAGILGTHNNKTGVNPRPSWRWLLKPAERFTSPYGRLFVQDNQLVFYNADNKNTFKWNQDGYLFEISDPDVGRVHLDYSDGRLARVTDPASGDWIKFEYDDDGHIQRAVDSAGRQAVYLYTADGKCLASRDIDGQVLGFLYDRFHNLTAIRYADGRTQRVQYDAKRDWVVALESRDNHPKYEFDYYSAPGDGSLYRTNVRSFWKGRPTSWSTTKFGELEYDVTFETMSNRYGHGIDDPGLDGNQQKRSLSGDFVGNWAEKANKKKGSLGSERWDGTKVYGLRSNPMTERFTNMITKRQRSTLEYDSLGRPDHILKPDGSVVRFSYDGDTMAIKAVQTNEGRYHFERDETGLVSKVQGPHQFNARIVRKNGFPLFVESADWTIELVRNQHGGIIEYRLLHDGTWKNVAPDAVQRLLEAMNNTASLWKLGQSINWPEDRDNAELSFVLQRVNDLFDALSRSSIPEHSLSCSTCFPESFANDLKGYDEATFEMFFLPKHLTQSGK